jgi:hypothetical protein
MMNLCSVLTILINIFRLRIELNVQRSFDLQKQAAIRNNIQLVLSGLTAITGIITTVVAIRR